MDDFLIWAWDYPKILVCCFFGIFHFWYLKGNIWFLAYGREACFILYRYFESMYISLEFRSLIADRIYRDRDYKTDLFIEEVTYCVGLQQENRFSLSAGLAVCVCLLHAKSFYIKSCSELFICAIHLPHNQIGYYFYSNRYESTPRGIRGVKRTENHKNQYLNLFLV